MILPRIEVILWLWICCKVEIYDLAIDILRIYWKKEEMQRNVFHDILRYVVLLGKRSSPNPIATFPPTCMRHTMLYYLMSLPHNIPHYLEGCDYFQRILLSGIQSGLYVDFVFNDNIDDESFICSLTKGLNVFLICTDDEDDLMEMNISLSRVCPKNCLFWIDEQIKDKFLMPNTVTSAEGFWNFLFGYSLSSMAAIQQPLAVPLCCGSVKFPYFKPGNITFFTLMSALGNWGLGTQLNVDDEAGKISDMTREAMANMQSDTRQERAVELISQLYALCQDAIKGLAFTITDFKDQFYPPLLIAAPYTTKDVRDLFKSMARNEEDLKCVEKVVELEQTPNYCYDVNMAEFGCDLQKINSNIRFFQAERIDFLDIVASLHSSFRFSPYLRLPLIGKSINGDLSFVSVQNSSRLAYSRNRQAYDKVIHKIGNTLASRLLAPNTIKMLEKVPSQIVAITDLPIEWMEVNGVPLAFTHDICRIPETPVSGILAHYGISKFASMYRIPKDIMSKTLVVYGCREEEFVRWQDSADDTVKSVGARSVICSSMDDFERQVKKYKPELLIIDTHGGTDLDNHQSYLMMGDEKVFPKNIAERGISARMVFLSACNTAPCYNAINTVANAFIEAGAFVVTSSYLPLEIAESSILYIRILRQLSIAAKKNVHRNWLSFISHILRTSFVMTPLVESLKDGELSKVDPMAIGKVNAISMMFENRTELYRKLKMGEEVEGLRYDFAKTIPHYLMYTTIGRADLVEFEVAVEASQKKYKILMENLYKI